MLDVVWLSFMKWNGSTPTKQFVGLDNYRHIFTQDPVFWGALQQHARCGRCCRSIFPPLIGFAAGARRSTRTFPAARRCARSSTCRSSSRRSPSRPCGAGCTIRSSVCSTQLLTKLGLQDLIQDWLGDPQDRALLGVRRLRLADRRLLDGAVPRRTARRLADADRGRPHRRRRPLADVPLRDVAGAAPDDHHRPDPRRSSTRSRPSTSSTA